MRTLIVICILDENMVIHLNTKKNSTDYCNTCCTNWVRTTAATTGRHWNVSTYKLLSFPVFVVLYSSIPHTCTHIKGHLFANVLTWEKNSQLVHASRSSTADEQQQQLDKNMYVLLKQTLWFTMLFPSGQMHVLCHQSTEEMTGYVTVRTTYVQYVLSTSGFFCFQRLLFSL